MPQSQKPKTLIIITGFLLLLIARQYAQAFALSLGYAYIALISLAGFWFCTTGGLIAASIASFIFIAEIYLYPQWPARDFVMYGAYLRFFIYYLSGIALGYLSCKDKILRRKLEEMAYNDELTGCVNYRLAMKLLEKEMALSRRYKKIVSVGMIDIDHFKRLNDKYGHITCNGVLKAFAKILMSAFRDSDTVGRYGGEEFIVILPETPPETALLAMDRVRERLHDVKVQLQGTKEMRHINFDFSAGIASFPYNGCKIEDLISSADNALYRAKQSGRARIFIEKRRWVRLKPAKGLNLEIIDLSNKDRADEAEIKDISQKGMLLIIPHDILGEELFCRLVFPQDNYKAEFKCKVVRKSKGADSTCRLGVYYLDLPEDEGKNILSRIASR